MLSVRSPARGAFFCSVSAEYSATAPPCEKPPTIILLLGMPSFSSSAIKCCTKKEERYIKLVLDSIMNVINL